MFCLALFCIAMVAATWSYGGGSWLHPGAPSHLFWENFWCDLLREPAHNGHPNSRSVLLATLGFGVLAGALTRWTGWLLIIGGVLGLLGGIAAVQIIFALGAVAAGTGFAWLGWEQLLSGGAEEAQQPTTQLS